MKKNRKKMDLKVLIEKQMNCWDQINLNIKIVSDNCKKIGKSLKEITSKATVLNDFHKANEKKHNKLIDNTHRDLSNTVSRLKATKINIISIKKNLNSSSSTSPTLRLPN